MIARVFFLVLVFGSLSDVAFSQINVADSLYRTIPSIGDSIANLSTDSINQLPPLPDSLLPSYYKVEAIRLSFNQEADSIRTACQGEIAKIDTQTSKLNKTIDSLQRLDLPAGNYIHKLDSLNQFRTRTQTGYSLKLEDLKAKTTNKLKALDLPPQYNEPLQALTKNIDDVNMNSDVLKIPRLEIRGYSLPKTDGAGDLPWKLGEVNKIAKIGNLPDIETPVGDFTQITQKAKGYRADIKSIAGGNLNDVKELPKTIEAQASKIDGIAALQKQSGVVDAYKDQLSVLKDPQAGKEKAVEMAQEAAIDHFAGKKVQLKAAMDRMSKYKAKYSSVSSLKDIPKRPPNAMKGKPFIERLVPGFYFQFQQKNYNLFDFNPYAGYRISGRFTSGIGWNQRYGYNRRNHEWTKTPRIYGPRAYVDFKLVKGVIAHLEAEAMNTFVPSTIRFQTDQGQRQWVWSLMMGMKKEYTIYKNLKGTVLLQYNLFNPKYKAPYVDRLNSRIGLEYTLKKRNKSVSHNTDH